MVPLQYAAKVSPRVGTHFKLKVGGDPADDLRRAHLMRSEIGPLNKLMMDANQKWDVVKAIHRTQELAEVDPWWMKDPTSPDDILGHARIRREVAPFGSLPVNTAITG